jgi:hypothetical protein
MYIKLIATSGNFHNGKTNTNLDPMLSVIEEKGIWHPKRK